MYLNDTECFVCCLSGLELTVVDLLALNSYYYYSRWLTETTVAFKCQVAWDVWQGFWEKPVWMSSDNLQTIIFFLIFFWGGI